MSASLNELQSWVDNRPSDATHMMVVRDTYDNENYPVYVKSDEECLKRYGEIKAMNMTVVDEVYDFRLPLDAQLKKGQRVWNMPPTRN